jgi:hypothetical protein
MMHRLIRSVDFVMAAVAAVGHLTWKYKKEGITHAWKGHTTDEHLGWSGQNVLCL